LENDGRDRVSFPYSGEVGVVEGKELDGSGQGVRLCLGEGFYIHRESSLVILHSSIVNSIFP
jgi:hypothetical protein